MGLGAAVLTAWLPTAEQSPGCSQPSVTENKDCDHIKTPERGERGGGEMYQTTVLHNLLTGLSH